MPANITHMLIAHKALQKLKTKGINEFTKFAEMLDETSRNKNYKAYVNLGSLGPDLYYYTKLSSSFKDILTDGFVQVKGLTLWSYSLHRFVLSTETENNREGLCCPEKQNQHGNGCQGTCRRAFNKNKIPHYKSHLKNRNRQRHRTSITRTFI